LGELLRMAPAARKLFIGANPKGWKTVAEPSEANTLATHANDVM
jgi:hypothetical protein